jgi:hypothetical protein
MGFMGSNRIKLYPIKKGRKAYFFSGLSFFTISATLIPFRSISPKMGPL